MKLVFGEVKQEQLESDPAAPAKDEHEADDENHSAKYLRLLRCGKLVGAVTGVLLVILLAVVFKKMFSRFNANALASEDDVPAVAVVVTVEEPKYAPLDEVSKNQV